MVFAVKNLCSPCSCLSRYLSKSHLFLPLAWHGTAQEPSRRGSSEQPTDRRSRHSSSSSSGPLVSSRLSPLPGKNTSLIDICPSARNTPLSRVLQLVKMPPPTPPPNARASPRRPDRPSRSVSSTDSTTVRDDESRGHWRLLLGDIQIHPFIRGESGAGFTSAPARTVRDEKGYTAVVP